MKIVQVVNSCKGNFVHLSITAVFAHLLTESNKRLIKLKYCASSVATSFSDKITAAKQLIQSVIL